MASICKYPNGRIHIQFFDVDKKHRHTIRLGKAKESVAMRTRKTSKRWKPTAGWAG